MRFFQIVMVTLLSLAMLVSGSMFKMTNRYGNGGVAIKNGRGMFQIMNNFKI